MRQNAGLPTEQFCLDQLGDNVIAETDHKTTSLPEPHPPKLCGLAA